jgi:glycosyltransferase involved in cell wall biosynthesis
MGLVEELQRQGHDVHAITPVDAYTRHLVNANVTHHPIEMEAQGINPLKDLALIVGLVKIYSHVVPDVILHFTIKPNIYGSLAAWFLQIPVINNVSGLGTAFRKKNLIYHLATLLYRLSFKAPGKVFFQNEEDKEFFTSSGLVAQRKTGLLPGSGINTSKFFPREYKNEKPMVFLMIARLIYDKGVLEYIEAIRKVKARGMVARFQLLGAFDAKDGRSVRPEQIKAWVDEGLIEYLGTTDNVQAFIAGAHCVVLPSYREGTPRVLLEAACLCKPIIATDVPGCRQVVRDHVNGLLCKAEDPVDLAEKIGAMTHCSHEQRERMGLNGRQFVMKEYDENIVIAKYLDSIHELKPVFTLQHQFASPI